MHSEMTRLKRSLGDRCWDRPHKPIAKSRPAPILHEGFALSFPAGARDSRALVPSGSSTQPLASIEPGMGVLGNGTKDVRAYTRGSAASAQAAMSNPRACISHIRANMTASTTKGPTESRRALWSSLATKAGYNDPFHLEPEMIFAIMGALDLAGYRSSELYLDAAKSLHIASGHHWSQQLQQAARAAIRSCRRSRGPPKQAAGLPLDKVAELAESEPVGLGGPVWPIRSTILASWWLLREIEASRAQKKHIRLDHEAKKVTWQLPCSKTDQAALGAERAHTCSCTFTSSRLCPYHLMCKHLDTVHNEDDYVFYTQAGDKTTKPGWADTFQEVARRLGIPTEHQNGARAFTGHTARVSGARHMASSHIELWRIQLFGRWGSEVFLHYIQDTPLSQLHSLAQEASAAHSLQVAKNELSALLRQAQQVEHRLALPHADMLHDCEAAAEAPPPPTSDSEFIRNTNGGGKLHRVLDKDPHQHPRTWRTYCGWRYGRENTEHDCCSKQQADATHGKFKCAKCFPEARRRHTTSSSSSSSDSSHT